MNRLLNLSLLALLSALLLPAETEVTLNATATPSTADPAVTSVYVTGHGFPSGTIPAANVTVTFNPTTVGGGPTGTTTATKVTVVSGTTERVTFKVPTSIRVTAPTSYQVSISGTTSAGKAFQSSNSAQLTVNAPVAVTTASPLPNPTVGINYSDTLEASGGTGQYTWTVTSGALPGGLTLSSAGQITGQPSAKGVSHFVAKATDSDGLAGSKAFAVTVDPALSITTSSPLPTGTVGVNYSQTFAATGGSGVYTWSVAAGALPGGLTLNATSGQLTGTPSTAGAPNFTIQVTDSTQASVTKGFSVTINAALVITTNSPLPTGTVNVAYSQTLAANGGSGQYTWSVSSGSLPAGLTLSAATGKISGSPSTAGTPGFTIQVTDTNQVSATKAFTVTIDSPVVITSTSPLPNGEVGVAYSQTLTATGGSGQYTWSVSAGTLPANLTLTPSTGLISGSPTTAATANFTILATDTNQATATRAFALTITPAAQLQTLTPNSSYQGLSLQVTIAATNSNFVQGTTVANFGPGISVGGGTAGQPGPVTVNSSTSATADIVISATATVGSQTVTVTTGGEVASLINGFTIQTGIMYTTITTTATTPMVQGFSGFADEYLIHGVEYWDPKFLAMVEPLKPGWIRFPSGSPSMAFSWQTGEFNSAWIAQLKPDVISFVYNGLLDGQETHSGQGRSLFLGRYLRLGLCDIRENPGR